MESKVISKTVEYDPKKHFQVKRSVAICDNKGEPALLVRPEPKDVLFDVKEVAKLDKKETKKIVDEAVGRTIVPTRPLAPTK